MRRIQRNGVAAAAVAAVLAGGTWATPAPAQVALAPVAAPMVAAAPTVAAAPATGVIRREGQQLRLNGQQYKFAGLNADTWFGCWDGEYERTTDANLDRYFAGLNPHSMTRVWAYAETPWETLLPRIVASAERHQQYLMVTLSDANDGGRQCGSNKGRGYPADGGPVLDHIRDLVPQFAGTRAIGVWEVVNEGTRDASAQAWYRRTTDEIARLDPDTLVTTGAGACYETDWQQCVAVDDVPSNDLVGLHEYDWNGGGVSHWADETAHIADQLGLPWYVGETGFCCGGGDGGSKRVNADRLRQEWDSYLAQPDNVGMLYWDVKWGYSDTTTINLGDPMWRTASTYRHPYQGLLASAAAPAGPVRGD